MKNLGFIKFLGTSGARFVMIRQLRSSAGIWINYKSTNVLVDPGPGAIIRTNKSRPKLDPGKLDGIILTHKHLDHSGDINVMIEAMTEGGFNKRGMVFIPADAVGPKGIIFPYIRHFPKDLIFLKNGKFCVGDIKFSVPIKNIHSKVETYGLKFFLGKEIISFVADSLYFKDLIAAHRDATILVLNVVFLERRPNVDHFCLQDAIDMIKKIKPKKAILTHFGMGMLKAKPHILEKKILKDIKIDIKFAYDGMTLPI